MQSAQGQSVFQGLQVDELLTQIFPGCWMGGDVRPTEAGNRRNASLVFQYLNKYSNTVFSYQHGTGLDGKVSTDCMAVRRARVSGPDPRP